MSIHCRKCNRVLKNPIAIQKGIGPVCERREHIVERWRIILLFRGITPNDGDTDIFEPYDCPGNVAHDHVGDDNKRRD